MNKEKAIYIRIAVVLAIVVCIALFLCKEKRAGRYSWGRGGTAVLDTVDGTVYMLTSTSKGEVSVTEVHLPSGSAQNRESKASAKYFSAENFKFEDE